MAGFYVKAQYKFDATRRNEVSLRVNDVAFVVQTIDANWYYGIVHKLAGNFPINFVQTLQLPPIRDGEKLFVGIGNFDGQVKGDLSFTKGDIIIGTSPVDENWWMGHRHLDDTNSGIFPLTHVEELNRTSNHCSVQPSKSKPQQPISSARALSNFSAQLENELSFAKGDVIEILEVVDDVFAIGRCKRQVGQFPLSFVREISENDLENAGCNSREVHSDKEVDSKYQLSKNSELSLKNCSTEGYQHKKTHSRKESYTQANTRSHDSFVTPYAKTLYPFVAVNENELSFKDNEIIKLIGHLDGDWTEGEIDGRRGIFPTNYVDIIVDCLPTNEKKAGGNDNGTENKEEEMYGRVLYNFKSETSRDLDLNEGDTVTILRKLNSDWCEARHDDGRVGLCPITYVEVFGSEPPCPIGTPQTPVAGHEFARQELGSPICFTAKSFGSPSNEVVSPTHNGSKPKPAVLPKPQKKIQTARSTESDSYYANDNLSSSVNRSNRSGSSFNNSPVHSKKSNCETKLNLDESFQRELLSLIRTKGQGSTNVSENSLLSPVRTCGERSSSSSALASKAHHDAGIQLGSNGNFSHDKNFHFRSSSIETGHSGLADFDPLTPNIRPSILDVTNDSTHNHRKVSSKKKPLAPPRPCGPRPLSTAVDASVVPTKPRTVPKRCAPPCPESLQFVPPRASNLMEFSPDQVMADNADDPRKSICDQKQFEMRQNIISELLKTENDYVTSLTLCLKTFSESKGCPAILDLNVLFGNAHEVVQLSQKLLALLEVNVEERSFDEQVVGLCFIQLKEDIKKVYAPYCRNHDCAIALLEKFESNKEVTTYFQQMLEKMRLHFSVFDLGSILIKPVQRILKYPLLLSELDKSTDASHIDKRHLPEAIRTMMDIAAYINEYKRRKDLVLKYKQDTDVKFSDKIGKLTMHSTKKKIFRMSQKMVGVQTVDEDFNREEQRFRALDSLVRSLTTDISQYVEQAQETVFCCDEVASDISAYFGEQLSEFELDKLCTIHSFIANKLFKDFKSVAEEDIIPSLNSLLLMFQGPFKVIRKRYDKLLDYDNASTRLKGVNDAEVAKAASEELLYAKNNYDALNAQLLDELPKLYNLSIDVITSCLHNLVRLQNDFHREALNQMFHLLALHSIIDTSSCTNIIEAFDIGHTTAVEKLASLSLIPKTFSPLVEDIRKLKEKKSSCMEPVLVDLDVGKTQCEGQKVYLRQKYQRNQLFVVTSNFVASQAMDLDFPAGCLVGVIQEKDPMGNKDRWFVDTGAAKGFIQKHYLAAYDLPSSDLLVDTSAPAHMSLQNSDGLLNPMNPHVARKSSDSSSHASNFSAHDKKFEAEAAAQKTNSDWTQFTTEDDPPPYDCPTYNQSMTSSAVNNSRFSSMTPPVAGAQTASRPSSTIQEMSPKKTLGRALYSFDARAASEISLKEGQFVQVLQEHDLDGNVEWWLVVDESGKKGYAPANYLCISR